VFLKHALITATGADDAFKKALCMIDPFIERNHYDEVHEGCEQHPYDGEYFDFLQLGGRWSALLRPSSDEDSSAIDDSEVIDGTVDPEQALVAEEVTDADVSRAMGTLLRTTAEGEITYADEPATPEAIFPIEDLTEALLASVIQCGVVWVEKENPGEAHHYGRECCATGRSRTPIPALGALMQAHPEVNFAVLMDCHW
jgi:hypothetical protein